MTTSPIQSVEWANGPPGGDNVTDVGFARECVKWDNWAQKAIVGDNATYEYFVGVGGNARGPKTGPNTRNVRVL